MKGQMPVFWRGVNIFKAYEREAHKYKQRINKRIKHFGGKKNNGYQG